MLVATIFSSALIVQLASVSARLDPHYIGNRTTMVHLFEWKWNDIAEECKRFLGPQGYGGVQVSPIQENAIIHSHGSRPWWERYQPISYLWETRSGNEQEFRAMVKTCNDVEVRIYVDVVFNHMTGSLGDRVQGTGPTVADTNHKHYPTVPYTAENFHPACEVHNYQNAQEVRGCELVGLHDLDQSQESVRQKIVDFLNKAVDAGVAGFRIDAAKHMHPGDLAVIYSRIKNLNPAFGFPKNAKPYIFQEVIDKYGHEAIKKTDYNHLADVTEFKYGLEVSGGMRGQNSLHWFRNFGEQWGLLPSDDALVFIDNHDNQREEGNRPLTYKEPWNYKAAIAFMLAHPYGKPRVMSSFEFEDFNQGPPTGPGESILSPSINKDSTCGNGWRCEHRWRSIRAMVNFRNFVKDLPLTNWWDNGAAKIAFCRGNRGFFAVNKDNTDMVEDLQTCLPPGKYCDIITGDIVGRRCTGKEIQVMENGVASIQIKQGGDDIVLATHVGARV